MGVKGTQGQTERVLNDQNWNNLSKKKSKVVLNCNPRYKISIYEFVLT